MPTFNRDALRKGAKAIDDALEARKQGDGDFKPFLSNIYWKKDKDTHYLMILNPLEEIDEVDLHPYIDIDDGKPHMCISHTDVTFGGGKDEIQTKWGYKPRLTNLAVAVLLEPITEIINGRAKPVGFEVQTTTFNRSVRGEDGKPIEGEKEEVTVPVVGLLAQSPYNFFNHLRSIDASEAAIHTTAVKIERMGDKSNVNYRINAFDTITPDLTNLFDYFENLSYIGEDDKEDLIQKVAGADTDEEASVAIGNYLLEKRVDELADVDEYNRILSQITQPARFQDQNKKEDKKQAPPKRPSQRRRRPDGAEDETPAARSREPEETSTQESAKDARMNKLRARSRTKKNESE